MAVTSVWFAPERLLSQCPLMALSVIRGAATFLVAIGATTDIDRHGRWIARSRLTQMYGQAVRCKRTLSSWR